MPEGEPTRFGKIDHIAVAVRDLEEAVSFFKDVLGFTLRRRLQIRGKRTGMISAEMEHNGIRFVLCQGSEPESQVSRLVSDFGPGVAHIALAVDDVQATVDDMSGRGLGFDTNLIVGPGLTQSFSSRCANTGMCFEFISRDPEQDGFVEANVQQLFDQLEAGDRY
jgi:methylmalonyl-CoA/ethylmalonyl-CoA epimerase